MLIYPRNYFYFLINRVCIFLLTRILVRTMSRKIPGLCIKSFAGLVKYYYFLRFRTGSRNIFVNKKQKNFFFIFLIMLPKSVHMGWKFIWSLASSITFCVKKYFTWDISHELSNCLKIPLQLNQLWYK